MSLKSLAVGIVSAEREEEFIGMYKLVATFMSDFLEVRHHYKL